NSRLTSSPEAAKRRLNLSPQVTRWDMVLDPSAPAVFLDLCHTNSTVHSRLEAEVITELIECLLLREVLPEEIGVVVPYRAQSRLIRSLLRRSLKDDELLSKLMVDTVERMQGQEREVILFSFTTASPKFAAQMAEFLFQPQRLNVAVTRPRTKLILVGSHAMFGASEYSLEHRETLDLLRDLINSCETITIPGGDLSG
ncbi:MAG: C-terminal helicase domain-containing protein, partial [Chloroflexota bacterium]